MKGLGVIYLRVERVESFLPFLVEFFSAFFLVESFWAFFL